MRTIYTEWASFREAVIAKNAPPHQLREMKLAFYGGAAGVLAITKQITIDNLSDDAGAAVLEGLHQEAQQFATDYVTQARGRK